jgi:Bifunctional DNA primase/polymerase, N-terminal
MAPVVDIQSKRPFTLYAERYWEAGWIPLPIPPNRKNSPPKGTTGRYPPPRWADVEGWLHSNEISDRSNIAIRVPDDIIGIDVDAYPGKVGKKLLIELEGRLGDLPPTWVSTSRDDGVSGIRFYRVPAGLHWPREFGKDVQVIQHRHRYSLGYPSINPDSHNQYRWYPPGAPLDGVSFHNGIPDLRSMTRVGVGAGSGAGAASA